MPTHSKQTFRESIRYGWTSFCSHPFSSLRNQIPYSLIEGTFTTALLLLPSLNADIPLRRHLQLVHHNNPWNVLKEYALVHWEIVLLFVLLGLACFLTDSFLQTTVLLGKPVSSTAKAAPKMAYRNWKKMQDIAFKTFCVKLTSFLVFLIAVAATTTVSFFTSPWVILFFLPLFLYYRTLTDLFLFNRLLGKKKWHTALLQSAKQCHRHFPLLGGLQLTTLVPLFIVGSAFILSVLPFMLAFTADIQSQILGNESGIPPYSYGCLYITVLIFTLILNLTRSICFLSMTKAHECIID